MQEIKDEILEGEARYRIRDNNGNIIQDNVNIEQITPVIQEGAPINKALLENIQNDINIAIKDIHGNLYASDRYNKPLVIDGFIDVPTMRTDNLFNKSWTKVSDAEYVADDGTVLIATTTPSISNYPLTNAFDNNEGTYTSIASSTTTLASGYMEIILPTKIKITKMKVRIASGVDNTLTKIQGSQEGGSWIDLYSATKITPLTEIELLNADYYKKYRIYIETTGGSGLIYEWQTSEYAGTTKKQAYINVLDLPLTSYEEGKIVRIQGGIGYTSTPTALITGKYIPVMSSTSQDGFEIGCLYNDTTDVQNIWDAFDGNTDTSYFVYKATTGSVYPLIYVKLDQPRIVTGITATSFKESYIMGSNDGKAWTRISTSCDFLGTEVTFENKTPFLYYGIEVHRNSSGYAGSGTVYEFQITSWYEDELTEVKTFTNPYLNINNLGNVMIDGKIKANAYYELIYNGAVWLVNSTTDIDTTPQVITSSGSYEVYTDVNYNVIAIGGGGGCASYTKDDTEQVASGGAGGRVETTMQFSSESVYITIGSAGRNSTRGTGLTGDNTVNATAGGDTKVGSLVAYGGTGGSVTYYNGTAGTGGGYAGGTGTVGANGATASGSSAHPNGGVGYQVNGVTYGNGGEVQLRNSDIWTEKTAGKGCVVLYPLG